MGTDVPSDQSQALKFMHTLCPAEWREFTVDITNDALRGKADCPTTVSEMHQSAGSCVPSVLPFSYTSHPPAVFAIFAEKYPIGERNSKPSAISEAFDGDCSICEDGKHPYKVSLKMQCNLLFVDLPESQPYSNRKGRHQRSGVIRRMMRSSITSPYFPNFTGVATCSIDFIQAIILDRSPGSSNWGAMINSAPLSVLALGAGFLKVFDRST